MRVPILTAVADTSVEAALVAAFERAGDVDVVQRCVDVAELLAAAATGRARAVLVSADLRLFDRDVAARLGTCRVAVVGLAAGADPDAHERRLHQMGISRVVVLRAGQDPAAIVDSVAAALLAGAASFAEVDPLRVSTLDPPSSWSFADPLADQPLPGSGSDVQAQPPPTRGPGHLLSVWGPAGAPGRSSLALHLAAELAATGLLTLLVDADTYGGVQSQALGLLDEAPGLTAAVRAAGDGRLDVAHLSSLVRDVGGNLGVLTGITRAQRWPEVPAAGFAAVLATCRWLAPVTVVDCGFCLETDEELSYDTLAPRRNGVTLQALDSADLVLAVGSADPIGLARLVRGLAELVEILPGADIRIVLNRLRPARSPALPDFPDAARALLRHTGRAPVAGIPLDVSAFDAAHAAGRTLREAAAGSPAQLSLASLAAELVGAAPQQGRVPRRRGARRVG